MSDLSPVQSRCHRCGALLAPEARGNCPACLLRGAVSAHAPRPPFPAPKGYTLVSELGRGGSGVVWKARQQGLEREVALKVLAAGMLAGDTENARLRREAEAMARLNHPHILSIHEVGEVDGYVFIAMEFVGGGTLADRLKGGPLTPLAAASLLRDVTDAVRHAHACGVIHRDLKPANILLDALGAPHLADFGLAKLLSRGPDDDGQPHTPFELTLTGHPLGTVHYLAPEQAGGSPRHVTPGADIHALGAILYHCLTGRPPYLGSSFADTLRQVVEQDPPSVRSLNPSVPKDLENICLKCLRKQPAQRYGSAAELFEDLVCFLHRKPVAARPLPGIIRLWTLSKRFPVASFFLIATLALLLAGIAISNHHAGVERRLRVEATRAARKLEFAFLDQSEAKGQKDFALKTLAQMARKSPDDLVIAKRLAWALQESPLALPSTPPLQIPGSSGAGVSRNHRWLAAALSQGQLIVMDTAADLVNPAWTRNFQGVVDLVVLSSDGRFVIGASYEQMSMWDRDTTNQITRLLEKGRRLACLEFSDDSRLLATADDRGEIELWDLPSFQARRVGWKQSTDVRSLRFSHNGRFLSTGSKDSPMQVWDVVRGQRHVELTGSSAQHDWTPGGDRVLACNLEGGQVEVWNMKTKLREQVIGPMPAPTCAVYSPSGRLIATATYSGIVQLWNAQTGAPVGTPMDHAQWVSAIEFSPDGSLIGTVCHDGLARIWSVESTRLFCQPLVHSSPLRRCSFTSDGRHVFTQTGGGWGQLWYLPKVAPYRQSIYTAAIPYPLDTAVTPVALSPDGSSAAIASGSGLVQLSSLDAVASKIVTLHHEDAVHLVEFSQDSKVLAAVTTNGVVHVWDRGAAKRLRTIRGAEPFYTCIRFSKTGRTLILGGDTGSLDAVDVDSGTMRSMPKAHAARIRAIEFFPAKHLLATGSQDYTIRLWDSDSLQPVGKPLLHPETPSNLSFSPEGDILYASCEDSTLRRWSLSSGKEILPPFPLEGPVYSLHMARDGNHLLNACNDGNARLWNLQSNTLERLFPMPGQMHACFSSDESMVAIGNDEGVLRVYDVESGLAVSGFVRQMRGWITPMFTPNGKWLVAGSRAIEARQWSNPPITGPIPDWLIDFADAASGRDLNAVGSMVSSSPAGRWKAVEAVRQLKEDSDLARWAKGLLGTESHSSVLKVTR